MSIGEEIDFWEDENPKIIGFAPIKDEIECIEGWFANISSFCSEVWAIYDPRSTDGTLEWLIKKVEETKNAKVSLRLYKQEILLGDSTREKKGTKGEITYISNINRFLHNHVPENHWCMFLAADERINIEDKELVFNALRQSDASNADALVFDFYDMYPDEDHRVGYENIPGLVLNHKKIFRRTPEIFFGTGAHTGEYGLTHLVRTGIPFYHFGWIKEEKQECWWRNWDGIHRVEEMDEEKAYISTKNPFQDWRHLA